MTDVMEREAAAERAALISSRFVRLEGSLFEFRQHAVIDRFLQQYRDVENAVAFRFKALLLRGKTRSAKTQKAASLFSYKRSLLVNMQGLGPNLPSLRAFHKNKYDCIIFDEASHMQVVANKMLFQAGPWPVTLGQSACGQHAYELDVYGVPMILCSNNFKLHVSDGLDAEESEWLRGNIMEAELPSGAHVWYHTR